MKLKISDIDDLGRGLAKDEGKIWFINKALLDEEVDVKVILDKKKYGLGKIHKILKASNERKCSFCPYSFFCDGCAFDITSYENSIKLKEDAINKMFKYENIIIPEFKIVKNPKTLGYRNKISLKVLDGQVGYYEEATHNFIAIKHCALVLEAINKVIEDFNLYYFKKGNLQIRSNDNNEILLIISTKEPVKISDDLYQKHKIVGVIINDEVVYNDSFFYERRNGLLYKVSYDAFFQVNAWISEKISQDIMNFITSDDIILDLYCGVGYFSLKMALKAKEVIGIEVLKNAVLDALKNKELNHLNNVNFLLGKVEDKIDKIAKKFTKVLVDPPRSGLDKKTINFLLAQEIPTIIYISCNPKTLKRDIKVLIEKYKILDLKGYDMFSYTKHVECVCILNLRYL